jgi:hypothetical protein
MVILREAGHLTSDYFQVLNLITVMMKILLITVLDFISTAHKLI